ncbi:hypothetical protein RHECNPAF_280087 [Rhizobium etli CNPAF512]|nr:hypothetical protein RHECNPAF_280087 [Rhizobium etli CNPAF512]
MSFSRSGVEIEDQQFVEMVHVLEDAEGRWRQLENGRLAADFVGYIVEHRLPARQGLVLQPFDRIGEGHVELIVLMVRLAIAEKIGKGIAPGAHDPAVLLGCPVDEQARRASFDDGHLEGLGHRETCKPGCHQRGHVVDRRLEREIAWPAILPAPGLDEPFEKRHVKAGDRREEELRGLRHRQICLTRLDQRRQRLRTLLDMADDGIAGFRQKTADLAVAAAEMGGRDRIVGLRVGEKLWRKGRGGHGRLEGFRFHCTAHMAEPRMSDDAWSF